MYCLHTHLMFLTSNTGSPLPLPPGQLNESSSTVCRKFGMTQFSSKAVTKTFLAWLHFRLKILHFRFVTKMVTKTFLAAFSCEDSSLSFCDTFRWRVELREREKHIEKSFCLLCFQKETKRKKGIVSIIGNYLVYCKEILLHFVSLHHLLHNFLTSS